MLLGRISANVASVVYFRELRLEGLVLIPLAGEIFGRDSELLNIYDLELIN